jgi:hypothetical protein
MARNYQGVDLARAALDAQAYRQNEMMMRASAEQLAQQRKMQTLLPEARRMAFQGDFTLLYQLAPQEAEAMKAGIQKRTASEFEQKQKWVAQKEQEKSAKVLGSLEARRNALSYVASNPQAAPNVQQYIDQLAQSGQIEPFDVMKYQNNPNELKSDLELTAFQFAMNKNPEATKMGAEILEEIGRAGDVSAMFSDEFKGAYKKRLEAKKSGGVNVTVSPQINMPSSIPLDKKVATDMQREQIGDLKTLSNLDDIIAKTDEKYLTTLGRIEGFAGGLLDKAGLASEDMKKYLGDRRVWREGVSQIFNSYRKEITGAAAAQAELSSLKDSIINADLGPSEFNASVQSFREKVARTMRIRNRLINEGLDIENPIFGQRLDELYAAGIDPKTDEDRLTRAKQLMDAGNKKADIVRILKQEGYLE